MAFKNTLDNGVVYKPVPFDDAGGVDHEFGLGKNNGGLKGLVVRAAGDELEVSFELDPKKQTVQKQLEEILLQASISNIRVTPSYGTDSGWISFETKDPQQIMMALSAMVGHPDRDEHGVVAPREAAQIAGILVEQGIADATQSGYARLDTLVLSNGIALRDIKFQQNFMGIQVIQENSTLTDSSFLATGLSDIAIFVRDGIESRRVADALIKNKYEIELKNKNLDIFVKGHPEGKFNFSSVVETLANEGMLPDTVAKMAKEYVSQVPQATIQSSFMTAPAQKAAAPIPQAPRQNVGGLNR